MKAFGNQMVTQTVKHLALSAAAARECQQNKEKHDNFAMGKDLEIGMTSKRDVQLEHANEFPTKQNNLFNLGSSKYVEHITKGELNLNCESSSSKLKYEGCVTNLSDPQMGSSQIEASNRNFKASDISNIINNNTDELPSLELSLKRLGGNSTR